VALPGESQATAFASSEISVTQFSATPSSGAFALLDPWIATGFAEAKNSLGQLDSAFDSSSTTAATGATVTWADAHGSASADTLSSAAGALATIGNVLNANSAATGLGSLWTTFEIADAGSGSVEVEFGLELLTSLLVFTDLEGRLAEAEAILTLEVGGQSVLLHHDQLSIGPSESRSSGFTGPLSGSIALSLNTPYVLVLALDAEARAVTVSDTSRLPIASVVAALTLVHRWRGRRRTSAQCFEHGGVP
jgi:hypothetical protein